MMSTFDTIINVFVFLSSALILFMAFAQIIVTKRHIFNILNFIIFVCLGMALLQFLMIYVWREQQAPFLYFVHLTTLYAAGPAGYLYREMQIKAERRLKTRKLLHFVPALAALLFEIVVQILPLQAKENIIYDMIMLNFSGGVNPFMLIRFFGLLHISGYLGAYLLLCFRNRNLPAIHATQNASVYSVSSIVFSVFLLIIAQLLNIAILFRIAVLLLSCVGISWFFISYFRPEFFYLFQIDRDGKHYERSRIHGINSDIIEKRLKALMEEEKAFCDEDITLKNIAEELSITTHQLSELLNSKLQINFKTLINTYRVEEAKRLLSDEPERTVLSIGFAVGFNSRSNFNTVFYKFTGKTPSEFRAQHS